MSFFSNPLAEEDEVVPPDYPLEQYDERKREDDFNELLVRSAKLETAQRSAEGDTAAAAVTHPDLVQCLKQNQRIRTTLEEGWGDISDDAKERKRLSALSMSSLEHQTTSPLQTLVPPSLATAVVPEAVAAQMQNEAVRRETVVHLLRKSVEEAAEQCRGDDDYASTSSLTASAYTVLHEAALSPATGSHRHTPSPSASSAIALSEIDVGEVVGAVQELEALLPDMSMEEAALAAAAVQHLYYGLRSWTSLVQRHAALHRSVAAKAQERKEAYLAAGKFARWMAARQLAGKPAAEAQATPASDAVSSAAGPAVAAAAAPSLSFDLALAESLNKELNEENWRLEAVLARLLVTQGEPQLASTAGSALVQHVSLLDHARELEAEVERLGNAVLYLRAALADPASLHTAADFPALRTEKEAEEEAVAQRMAAREAMWAARLTHLSTLEKSLRSSSSSTQPFSLDEDDDVASSADQILSCGLTKLLELYDAGLHAVALLSTFFEGQSASASFLVHAVRGGGPLADDDAVVERVVDFALPDVATVRQTVEDVASTCADVARGLDEHLQKAVAATAATQARWERVRTSLAQLLHETLVASAAVSSSQQTTTSGEQSGAAFDRVRGDKERSEAAALLRAYSEQKPSAPMPNASQPGTVVRAEPSWASVLQEEVEAFAEEKAVQRKEAKEYWLNQQAEADKKLTWLMKQPNAPLLLQLCAAEREREDLRQQLKLLSNAEADASALQHTLDYLQAQLTAETHHNAQLQEELEAVQARRQALERERSSLLVSLP